MKIDKKDASAKVEGKHTMVGKVYIFDGTDQAYFRHETGLANLENGKNQPLETIVGGKRFTLCPNAVLTL